MTNAEPGPLGSDEIARRARLLLDSGLLDVEFYSALRGRGFGSALDAALDAVAFGMPARLGTHPFLDVSAMTPALRRAWQRQEVPQVLRGLSSEKGRDCSWGPLFDPRRYQPTDPAANPLIDFLTTSAPETPLPTNADRSRPAVSRAAGRRALVEAARRIGSGAGAELARIDWEPVARDVEHRVAGRTSVVIPTYDDRTMTVRAVDAVLLTCPDDDIEVIVVDNGSVPRVALGLAAAFAELPRVRLVRLPENANFATGSNVGFAVSTGDVVVFLNNDTRVRAGWLAPLRSGLEDAEVAGVQPLLLYEDDTIQAAGTVFLREDLLPTHLLVGHPADEALPLAARRFSAVTAAAMALRAVDVVRLHGFDPAYVNGFEDVDLCLRALELRPGGFRVAPTAVVSHYESRTPGRFDRAMDNRRTFLERWAGRLPAPEPEVYADLGLVVSVTDDGQPVPAARATVTGRADTRQRWGIRIPSTAGYWGDAWGDTHFAESLARGLRACGHQVVTHRAGAHETPAAGLDDVALFIRGRLPVAPLPGRVNLLWVISHPEEIEPAELQGYDAVLAASTVWSSDMSARAGVPVIPLLQATEVTPVVEPRVAEAVFVGSAHQRSRPLVDLAVESGIPLAVHGAEWEHLPPGVWRSPYVPNEQLAQVYARHSLVLADHWPDMARQGFVANRVFDAVAAGALVACDDVRGVHDRFGAEVVVCRTPEDLRAAFEQSVAAVTDGDAARRVLAEDTFLARARALTELVATLG